MAVDKEVEQKINQLQLTEQNLQNYLMQKQTFFTSIMVLFNDFER